MSKILGIDTGTNSLGWAIVERDDSHKYHLLDHGTHVFQEGVKIEQGIESSKAAERTAHRSLRRHYWRRKLRKIRLLTILSENNLCPSLTKAVLREWREGKSYPQDEAFMAWQRTEDKSDINPYAYRYRCLTENLDLNELSQRYILGRALYHINQRRGFLSNRKETSRESEDGKVKAGISDLTNEILESGCSYLGEYFYHLYQKGERIRAHYTARSEHYLAEFKAICAKQELSDDLVAKLESAIFTQRPLKSQKSQVGKCIFEPKKSRCPVSHPLYEEFRMYSFINNIKVQTPDDCDLRPLNASEVQAILPLFYRKTKTSFAFEEIAKKISGGRKNTYSYYKDANEFPYRFNYHMDTTVSGCPVTAGLMSVFGDDWLPSACETYVLVEGKTEQDILNDIWHALFFYDNEEKLCEFAKTRLQLSEDKAKSFSKISVPQEYAALSLKAINKILPYLKEYGLIYSEAVFLANLGEIIPTYLWCEEVSRNSIIKGVIDKMHRGEGLVEGRVKAYLKDRYSVTDKDLEKLYHPSMIETYPQQKPNSEGIYQLGSPRINSVRNPMAMRSLFRVRHIVNTLLRDGKIDKDTIIHIEFSRDLNDTNKRKAIKDHQSDNEKNRESCRKKINELLVAEGIVREPSDTDILKYQLWEEQEHRCLYTGETIGLVDFLGSNPKYDIEHTVPQSVGGDSTKMNLTLCQSRFNREVKKAKLPSQLANHNEILPRIAHWKKNYEDLDKQIRKLKGSRASDKEQKDKIITKRHKLTIERDYWKGKYERFIMTSVPEGFSRRQGTDISVISRYARLYLKSVFDKVFIVKGIATSDFRKIWGIQEEYTKKERINHVHHCIDAITIACIGPYEYGQLANYYHELEANRWFGMKKPQFTKPWPIFTEDIKSIQNDLIVTHHTQDNMPKIGKRRVLTSTGKVLTQGDAARGPLHLDTYYGAIQKDGEVKYVVRKSLESLKTKDIGNIVDDEVRRIVGEACKKHGDLKKAVQADDVWMNKEKGVRINKVRIYARSVTRPVNIRKQRDLSVHEYKHQYHVMNDRNYMMAIYVGKNEKGREKREFQIFSVFDAAEYYKKSNGEKSGISLAPQYSERGYKLAYQLKVGTMVLLYENSPEEIWECSKVELKNRLYKVTGMSSMVISKYTYGVILMTFHQEAKPSTQLKIVNGEYKYKDTPDSLLKMLHTQIKGLIEGQDFAISETGEIKFL